MLAKINLPVAAGLYFSITQIFGNKFGVPAQALAGSASSLPGASGRSGM